MLLNSYSSLKKKQKDSDENSLRILAFSNKAAKLCNVSEDVYNHGDWLILQDLLKECVAKCVASRINDFILQATGLVTILKSFR